MKRFLLVLVLVLLVATSSAQERLFAVTGFSGPIERFNNPTPVGCVLYEIDATSGANLGAVGNVTDGPGGLQLQGCSGIAQDPASGTMFLTRNDGGFSPGPASLYTLDVGTGVATLVGNFGNRYITDIAVRSSDNALFAYDIGNCQLVELDKGTAGELGTVPFNCCACPNGGAGGEFLANDTFYIKDGSSNAYGFNFPPTPTVASFPSVSPPIGDNTAANFTRSPSSGLLYNADSSNLYTWTPAGPPPNTTNVGPHGISDLSGLAFFTGGSPQAVPASTPASMLALVASLLLAMATFFRSRL